METKRTYEEAVELMVEWWVKKSFNTPLNQNNGDNSHAGSFGFMLMNMASMDTQTKTSIEDIAAFKKSLTDYLLKLGCGSRKTMFDVDYDPNEPLYEACKSAGINTNSLPIKTFTYIDAENVINGRYQYGGEWFKI